MPRARSVSPRWTISAPNLWRTSGWKRKCYPRLRDEKKAREEVLEGYEEHHVADVILDELLDVPPETELWKAKVKVLKENVEHHMDEEEDELFKKARAVLNRDELESMGERMERIKRSAEDAD